MPKRVTNAKSVDELYETIKGHYLDEYDVVGVANELTELVNNQRSAKVRNKDVIADKQEQTSSANNIKQANDTKQTNNKTMKREQFSMIVGGITFFVVYAVIQIIVLVGWGNKGFPENEWFFGLLPTIIVVGFFAVATIIDLITKMKEKRGKK